MVVSWGSRGGRGHGNGNSSHSVEQVIGTYVNVAARVFGRRSVDVQAIATKPKQTIANVQALEQKSLGDRR